MQIEVSFSIDPHEIKNLCRLDKIGMLGDNFEIHTDDA